MAQFFKAQFQSFLKKRLSQNSDSFKDVTTLILQNFQIYHGLHKLHQAYVPKNNSLFYRIPQGELKHLAKLECPIAINEKSKQIHIKQQREGKPLDFANLSDIQNLLFGIYLRALQTQSLSDSHQTPNEVIIEQPNHNEQVNTESNLKDFSFRDYNSASIILQNLEIIYSDLIDNQGLQYKLLMNEAVKLNPSEVIPTENEKFSDKGKKTEISEVVPANKQEEIESLMIKIQKSKNRKEKRILMAKYNQQQGLLWGSPTAIASITDRKPAIVEENLENKVYNKATRSFVNKEDMENALKKDSINPNFQEKSQRKLTQVLSVNQKLHSINNYEKTQKFEFKVNLENEKQRQMFREVMAQKREFIDKNFAIIEAIEEGKRVSAYFENEDQAKQFILKLKDQKEEEKEGYGFKEIEEKSKLTRKKDHKVIPTREEISRQALYGQSNPALSDSSSNKNGQQENLLGEGQVKNDIMQLESGLQNKSISKKQQKLDQIEEMEELVRDDVKGDQTFLLSRAKPLDNIPQKAQENQKRKILNMTVDDRYIAENYYQNDMDELMHEKDGTISKMKQFDYKIHKYRKQAPEGAPDHYKNDKGQRYQSLTPNRRDKFSKDNQQQQQQQQRPYRNEGKFDRGQKYGSSNQDRNNRFDKDQKYGSQSFSRSERYAKDKKYQSFDKKRGGPRNDRRNSSQRMRSSQSQEN